MHFSFCPKMREINMSLYEKIIIYLRRGYYDEKFNKNYVCISRRYNRINIGECYGYYTNDRNSICCWLWYHNTKRKI